MWGRGGNLCHCNAMHFVGKRRDVQLGRQYSELGQQWRSGSDVDEQPWNDDDDALRYDDEKSTSADDEQTDGHAEWASDGRRQRRQPMMLVALRRPDRRHVDDQLLRDSAKKGERHKPPSDASTEDVMTLNALTRKPTTLRLPAKTKHGDVLRQMTSQSRLPTPNLDAIYRMTG